MEILIVLGGIALALISGAGGSALLEMFWRPRRDRKKAATLLLAEILLDTELLFMQAHARLKNPKNIPGDFHMSTLAWDTAASALVELPPGTLKSVLLLYNRYRDMNANVAQFAAAFDNIERTAPGSAERKRAERQADVIIDVFNTSIDSAIDHAKKFTPTLFKLAKLKPAADLDIDKLKSNVDRLFAERENRIKQMSGDSG
jgi:hypothetical protein